MKSGIKDDYGIVISMIKLLQLKRYMNKSKYNINLSKDSAFDYVYKGRSENSFSFTNSELSINKSRSRRRSSFIPLSRKTSRNIISFSPNNRKIISENEKKNNIHKARIFSFPSQEIVKRKESPKSFKSTIIKMNKIIEKDKQQEAQYKHQLMLEPFLTTYNYSGYLVKTQDGKQVYHREGPMINNFINELENSNHNDYLIDDSGREKSNGEIENNLLVRLKQDDINNDVYMNIVNEKNEEGIKKKRYTFGKTPMIQEEKNTITEINEEGEGEEVNEEQKPRLRIYFDKSEIPPYGNITGTDNNENNENINSEINEPVETENDNNINIESNDSERNDYEREDLLHYLNIDNENTKDEELSNDEFELMEKRLKHDQELLTKIENYQNILDIASVSVVDMVDFIEHGIDIRPILQNIVYNIQQNITSFSEDDIRNLEDMVIIHYYYYYYNYCINYYHI